MGKRMKKDGKEMNNIEMSDRRRVQRRGFTLVELLVVVSIIALLISILLPSLKNAREQAKTLKCLANLSGITKASHVYQADENEWLVGSPGTTGGVLTGKYWGQDPKFADMPEAPVQIWDFAGPLAAYSMGMEGLAANRGKRFEQIVEGIFACPSNRVKSVPYPSPTEDFGTIKSVSLHTVRNFMVWPRGNDGNYGKAPFDELYGSPGSDAHKNNNARMRVGGGSNIPDNYSPRISRVGQPSEKVYIADGSRFTASDESDDQKPFVDYDPDWDAGFGGAFSTGGPTLLKEYLRSYWFEDPARKFSYRHAKGKDVGIVIGFFDGHAGWISENASRDVSYWWPKGSTIPPNDMNTPTRQKYPRTAFTGPGNTYRVPN